MSYQAFSIESALVPNVDRTSVKLEGMSTVMNVLKSNSRGTEEFIQGAVASLGAADRQIMYVHSSLEALSDRLETAKKIANAINPAKAHGAEGFQNVPLMDPWAFAIESKAGEFFKRIWAAIRTACRRVLDAIVYFIKWVGNAIASADVKGQIKDYKFYTSNKARIEKYAKANGTGQTKFNAPNWKVTGAQLGDMITKASGTFVKMTTGSSKDMDVIENASKMNLSTIHDTKDFQKEFNKVFGLGESIGVGVSNLVHGKVGTAGGAYAHATHAVKTMKEAIEKDLDSGLKSVFGNTSEKGANALVMNAVAVKGKSVQMTVEKMQKLSGDFSVLDEAWLAKNVKQSIAAVSNQQKQFTQYTKAIDKLASAFNKSMSDEDNSYKALSKLCSELANARIRYNSFWSNLMLSFESAALRFRKSAHIALKFYIRAAKAGVPKKSEEALSPESVEALFNFN